MPNGETFTFPHFRRRENGGENVLNFIFEWMFVNYKALIVAANFCAYHKCDEI